MPVTDSLSEQQYVVFDLNDESYAVGIDRVQEIDRLETVTRVPAAPPTSKE